MGWNEDYTVLTGPISLADIGRAAGYPQGKDGDDIFDGGWLFVNGMFNPMAKHKAFKSSAPGYAYDKNQSTPETRSPSRVAAAAAARYGMSEPSYFYPNSYAIPSSWTYNRPIAGAPNERFRPLDFDGYDAQAVPPLAMEVPGGLKVAATFATMLWKDSYVNNYLAGQSSKKWWADRSLSIAEILGGGLNDYNEYWIAFVFYRYNAAGTSIEDAALVVTNKKFGNISGVGVFMFYPQGDGTQSGDYIEGGIHYPVVPMLQSTTYVGRKFAIVACLSNTGPTDPITYAYQVLPNNYSCIPLGFDAANRWDYVIATAESEKAIDLLTGVFNTGPVLTIVSQHEGGWNEYSCAAWITADITSAAGWAGTSAVVNVKAYAPGGMFGGIPGSGSEYGEYVQDVSISVPSGGHTNTRQLIQLPNVFIYKDAPHTVVVNGKFTQNGNEKPFNNSLTISD